MLIMWEVVKDNAVWLTPVLVAIVSGVFYLLKKGGRYNKQTIGDVSGGNVNQTGGNIIINGKENDNVQ